MHLLKKKKNCSNPIYIRSEISLSAPLSFDLQLLVLIYSNFRTPPWTVGADRNDHQLAVRSSFNHSTVVWIIETIWTILSLAESLLGSLTSFLQTYLKRSEELAYWTVSHGQLTVQNVFRYMAIMYSMNVTQSSKMTLTDVTMCASEVYLLQHSYVVKFVMPYYAEDTS